MEENITKTCSKCNTEQPIERFYLYQRTSRPWPYCKSCHYNLYTKDIKKKWDEENPERKKQISYKAMRKYVDKNRAYWNEQQRLRYHANKAKKQDGN